MFDIQLAVMKLFDVAIGEGLQAGHRWLGARSAKADARAAAYQEFAMRVQRTHVRLNLLQAVVLGRRRRFALVPAVTGYEVHVELVDRLADDLVALSNSWQTVATIAPSTVVDKGQAVVDALTALATHPSARARSGAGPTRREERSRQALDVELTGALQEFQTATRADLQ